MAHGDTREGKWRGNWRMQWVASTLHTTSEHGVSSITTADAHTSAASSRLNWRPRRFKWTRPFRRKTKSGFGACAVTFQLQKGTTLRRIVTTAVQLQNILYTQTPCIHKHSVYTNNVLNSINIQRHVTPSRCIKCIAVLWVKLTRLVHVTYCRNSCQCIILNQPYSVFSLLYPYWSISAVRSTRHTQQCYIVTRAYVCFQAFAAMHMRSALFWVVTQRVVVNPYRLFGMRLSPKCRCVLTTT